MNRSMVQYSAGSSDRQWNERLLTSHSVVTNCGVSLHLCSMNPTLGLEKRKHNHTHPAFLWYMLEFIY